MISSGKLNLVGTLKDKKLKYSSTFLKDQEKRKYKLEKQSFLY